MKADVVFVFRLDVNHVPALTERIQQVVAEFDTLAVKQEPERSASGLGPELGSYWENRLKRGTWRVLGRVNVDEPSTVRLVRLDVPGEWTGSVAEFNKLFAAVDG